MNYDEWAFNALVNVGAIRDYSKCPPIGKGRTPKGNLSVQLLRIGELRSSTNHNEELWGLVGSTLLNMPETPGIGPRMLKEFEAFAQKAYPQNPASLLKAMQMAVVGVWKQYKQNYKETVKVA